MTQIRGWSGRHIILNRSPETLLMFWQFTQKISYTWLWIKLWIQIGSSPPTKNQEIILIDSTDIWIACFSFPLMIIIFHVFVSCRYILFCWIGISSEINFSNTNNMFTFYISLKHGLITMSKTYLPTCLSNCQ